MLNPTASQTKRAPQLCSEQANVVSLKTPAEQPVGVQVPAVADLSYWGAADTADTGRRGPLQGSAVGQLTHWVAADTADTGRSGR